MADAKFRRISLLIFQIYLNTELGEERETEEEEAEEVVEEVEEVTGVVKGK